MLHTIFIIGAAVCLGLAAFGVPCPKVSLGWLGLLLWLLATVA